MSSDPGETLGAGAARRFTEGFLGPFIGDFGYLSSLVRELQRTDDAAEVGRLNAELQLAEESARQLLELSRAANYFKDSAGILVMRRVKEEMFLEIKFQIRNRVGRYLENRSHGGPLDTEGMGEVPIDAFEIPAVYLKEILREDYELFLAMPSGREEILQRVRERVPVLNTCEDESGEIDVATLDAVTLFEPFQEKFGPRTFELLVNSLREDAGELQNLLLAGDSAAGQFQSDLEAATEQLLLSLLSDE